MDRYLWGPKASQRKLYGNDGGTSLACMEDDLRFATERLVGLRNAKDTVGMEELRRQMDGLHALKLAWED